MRTDSTSSYIFAIALSFADLAGKGFSASTFTNHDKTASYQYSTWCEKQVENSFVVISLLAHSMPSIKYAAMLPEKSTTQKQPQAPVFQ